MGEEAATWPSARIPECGSLTALRMADCGETHFLAVLANGGHDFESQRECAPAIFQRDNRGGALTDGSGGRISAQREAVLRKRPAAWSRRSADSPKACRLCAVGSDGEDQHFLATVIERNVLPGLEETQLANPLGGDAAGSEVRDAARFKLHAHVGDVRLCPRRSAAPRRALPSPATWQRPARCRDRGSSDRARHPHRANVG